MSAAGPPPGARPPEGGSRAATSGEHPTATGWRGPRNALILVIVLVAIWQALYWWIGDVALASPLQTLRYTAKMVSGESFGM